ncbi:MAG: AMP-binding protein, partial [Candidatus Margulisiibacteriota bacterium]
MEIKTIKEMLEQNAEKFRDQVAFQMRQNGGYRKITFLEASELAKRVQVALVNLGVGREDRVALISENRPEWPVSYLAIASLGAIVVPLDAMLSKEDILPLLEDSGAKAIILSEKYIEYFRGTGVEERKIIMEKFDRLPSAAPGSLPHEVTLDDLAAIVYTSGTTGIPKGVMLTQRNIMSNVIEVSALFDFSPKDNFLSVLPLHHTFENTCGFFGAFYNGCKITYAESLKSHNILQNMQETGVTIMCGVPLLFQLFYNGIMREVEEKKLKKVFSALFVIAKFFKYVIGFNIGKKLFATVQKKFGGKIRFFVSGGAPIDPEVIKNFDLMGFTILQGYGLTESSPILTCCTLKDNKIGSVGRAIPGVEIRISGTDPVGEILAFGPNIMKGYYKRKELTSRVVVNGWLQTGDVGYLDEEGHLFITGRSKDVIVTASGVNVYPEEIEFPLSKIPTIKEACVMGAKVKEGVRKGTEEVIALIVPDMEHFEKLGHTEDPFIQETISNEVQSLNKKMADYKR